MNFKWRAFILCLFFIIFGHILLIQRLTLEHDLEPSKFGDGNKKEPKSIEDVYAYLTDFLRIKIKELKPRPKIMDHIQRFVNYNYEQRIQPYMDKLYADKIFSIRSYSNHDEKKFSYSQERDSEENCTFISLGIGGDIMAERTFEFHFPNCKFFGADPTEEDGRIYEKIGKYFPLAISSKKGLDTHSVLYNRTKPYVYSPKRIESTAFDDFLSNYVNQSNIDHLWMDVEGQEYKLMPYILQVDKGLNPQYTICQMNIEFHGPFETYETDATFVKDLLLQFLTASSYVPLRITHCGCPHIRVFAINVKSKYCRDKYINLYPK